MPTVSVITPCHNDGQYLLRNLESVRRSGKDYEHVIVDDGSTDEATLELLSRIASEHVRVFRTCRSGPAAARNHAIRQARGRYILNLDADDMATPVPFEQGTRILDRDRAVDVVYGNYETFGAVHRTIHAPDFCPFRLLFSNRVGIGSLYRRSSWESAHGYAETGMMYEDWHFWLKILANSGGFHKVNDTFFKYFVRVSGKSFSDDRLYSTGFNQIRASLPALYAQGNLTRLARSSNINGLDRFYIQHAVPLLMQGRRTSFGKRMAWFASAHLGRRKPVPQRMG